MGLIRTASRTSAPVLPALAGACAVAATLSFAGEPVRRLVAEVLPATSARWQGLQFSLFYLVIGLGVVAWRPRAFGLQLGGTLREWRLLLGLAALVGGSTLTYLLLAPPTPYSGQDWLNEVIVVPFTEELIYRGIFFTVLQWLFGRTSGERRATWLAVVVSAVAFGVAHVSNVLFIPPLFVLFQVGYATLFGLAFSLARARTRSVFPAVALHALLNGLAISL
jgi:membrane protease YdiL (CAAX protease family)